MVSTTRSTPSGQNVKSNLGFRKNQSHPSPRHVPGLDTHIFMKIFGKILTPQTQKHLSPKVKVVHVEVENGLDDKVDPFGSICRVNSWFEGKKQTRITSSYLWLGHVYFLIRKRSKIDPTNIKRNCSKSSLCTLPWSAMVVANPSCCWRKTLHQP
jgi:hypothetical protein